MATIEKVVEVDLEDFTTQELIDELEWRGEKVNSDIDDYDDDDLIKELQSRDYIVGGKLFDVNRELAELYTIYQTMSPEFFEKKLKKFFCDHLNVYVK